VQPFRIFLGHKAVAKGSSTINMSHPEFWGNLSGIKTMPMPEVSPNLEGKRFQEAGDNRPTGD
jgi:hypothetical protein